MAHLLRWGRGDVVGVFMVLFQSSLPFTARLGCGGRDKWCPLKTTPTGRPHVAALFGERAKKPETNKNMNTTQNNIAAPSVTIAPRNPARGVLTFVVTLTTFKDTRSYPCRSLESATKLVERFIAGVTKPRPAAQPETTPAPAAEPVAA
jgi:hypothetical protein